MPVILWLLGHPGLVALVMLVLLLGKAAEGVGMGWGCWEEVLQLLMREVGVVMAIHRAEDWYRWRG